MYISLHEKKHQTVRASQRGAEAAHHDGGSGAEVRCRLSVEQRGMPDQMGRRAPCCRGGRGQGVQEISNHGVDNTGAGATVGGKHGNVPHHRV